MSNTKVFNDIYEHNNISSYSSYFNNSSLEERKNIIIEGLSFNHYNTIETIFLSFPQLWKDFSKEDWVSVLKLSIESIDDISLDLKIINSSELSFLRLLCTYLRINSFLLIQETNMSQYVINKCYEYGVKYSSLFYKNEDLMKEELDDFSNIDLKELNNIKNSLISQGCQEIESSPEELSARLLELF